MVTGSVDLGDENGVWKIWNASRFCVSSLRRGHANLLCIVPILVYVPPKRVRISHITNSLSYHTNGLSRSFTHLHTSHKALFNRSSQHTHTHQYALFQHKYNTQYTKSTHNSASQTTLNHSLLFSSIVIHNYIFKQPNAHTLKQTNKQTNTHTHRYIDSIELENNPKQFIVSYASS